MFEIEVIGPEEWFEFIRCFPDKETKVCIRRPDSHFGFADLKIFGSAARNGPWNVLIKTNGEWIQGIFCPRLKRVRVRQEPNYH